MLHEQFGKQMALKWEAYALIATGHNYFGHVAGLLGILRMAVETRRTALVDLSLDLIQKLIAHSHLAGSVYNISHKRDPAAGRSGRKVNCPIIRMLASRKSVDRIVVSSGPPATISVL